MTDSEAAAGEDNDCTAFKLAGECIEVGDDEGGLLVGGDWIRLPEQGRGFRRCPAFHPFETTGSGFETAGGAAWPGRKSQQSTGFAEAAASLPQ